MHRLWNICSATYRRRHLMRMRHTCACFLMVGGMLLFAGGASQAEQSKSGSQSGAVGTGSGSTGGSSGAMKQGHESSGKMGQDSSVITKDNPGGIVTRGGRGEMPSDSKVDPLSTDQRKDSPKSGPGGDSGSKGSSGNMGSSSGGTGSSGGGTGSSGGGGGY